MHARKGWRALQVPIDCEAGGSENSHAKGPNSVIALPYCRCLRNWERVVPCVGGRVLQVGVLQIRHQRINSQVHQSLAFQVDHPRRIVQKDFAVIGRCDVGPATANRNGPQSIADDAVSQDAGDGGNHEQDSEKAYSRWSHNEVHSQTAIGNCRSCTRCWISVFEGIVQGFRAVQEKDLHRVSYEWQSFHLYRFGKSCGPERAAECPEFCTAASSGTAA